MCNEESEEGGLQECTFFDKCLSRDKRKSSRKLYQQQQ